MQKGLLKILKNYQTQLIGYTMKVGNYTVGVLTAQVNYVLKDWDKLKQVELEQPESCS